MLNAWILIIFINGYSSGLAGGSSTVATTTAVFASEQRCNEAAKQAMNVGVVKNRLRETMIEVKALCVKQ